MPIMTRAEGLPMTAQIADRPAARAVLCSRLWRLSGNDVVAPMLWRPASEKRQGTKSRSEVHRWCGGLYGELTAAHELEAV
jgi:hypothetical protein